MAKAVKVVNRDFGHCRVKSQFAIYFLACDE